MSRRIEGGHGKIERFFRTVGGLFLLPRLLVSEARVSQETNGFDTQQFISHKLLSVTID